MSDDMPHHLIWFTLYVAFSDSDRAICQVLRSSAPLEGNDPFHVFPGILWDNHGNSKLNPKPCSPKAH